MKEIFCQIGVIIAFVPELWAEPAEILRVLAVLFHVGKLSAASDA